MKYTKQYSTEAAYDADSRIKPNVSLITENMDVKYNPLTISGRVAKAGTIVLVDNSNTSDKIFVPHTSYDKDTYSGYTAIGVVVVPFTHTPDETVRIMSLKNMSTETPDTGSVQQGPTTTSTTANERSMYWGGYGSDIPGLKDYDKIPTVDPTIQETGTVGLTDWARIPSDYLTGGTASTLDPGTRYYSGTETGRFGISPYTLYDWKSYKAFSVYGVDTKNCMNDFNGKSNTDTILAIDNATSTDWQTAPTISNVGSTEYVHPAAQCCWRYSTIGITQGQWYLPACGELLYINPRYSEINAALTKLQTADPTNAIRLWNYGDSSTSVFGYWLWSSTEYSRYYARTVNVYLGSVYNTAKSYVGTNGRVRAFAALDV